MNSEKSILAAKADALAYDVYLAAAAELAEIQADAAPAGAAHAAEAYAKAFDAYLACADDAYADNRNTQPCDT